MAEEKNASELIREALGSGVTKPKEIIQWVKENYQKEVSQGLVGQVKNRYFKGETTIEPPVAKQPMESDAETVLVDDLLILKHLKEKMGREGITKALSLFE